MENLTIKAKIVIRYLEKYYDDIVSGKMAKKRLARIIYHSENNKQYFKDIEAVRSIIRTQTNKKEDSPFYFKSNVNFAMKAYKLPETSSEERPDFIIPKKYKNLLVYGDVHIPYHTPEPIKLMLDHAKEHKIDSMLINGDLLDFYGISRFQKDPTKVSLKEELMRGKDFFEMLREHFPKIPIYYKLGNHEERWEHYLMSKAPEMFGIEEFKLVHVLGLENYGVEMVGSRNKIKFAELNIIHGHEFGESIFSPVNPARGVFLRAKCATLVNHHHQSSVHHENSLNNDSLACYSVGCLCELTPTYRPFAYTKWNHGFARIERKGKKGDGFQVYNYSIRNGEIK